MPRVLITGASGYVGSHVAAALLAEGWGVRGIARSARLRHQPDVDWVQGDVAAPECARPAAAGCAAIVHLACLPLDASARDPVEALRVNVGGTLQVLEAARIEGVARVVMASSGQVYGGQSSLPNRETHLPAPASPYAASKLCGEAWCESYRRTHGMSVTALRLFNVYGAAVDGQPRPTVESVFLRDLRAGRQPRVGGHPDSGRDFVHVRDVVRAIRLALECQATGPINVGTGVLTPFAELARLTARVLGEAVEPAMVPTGAAAERFQADTRRAEIELGFRAEVTLEAGLRWLAEDT
jgi:UDP-glucose 4-epimerase